MARRVGIAIVVVFFLLAVSHAAVAQRPVDAKRVWRDCLARDIATAIRGCTSIIERKGAKAGPLVRAHLARGKALSKRGQMREAIADLDYVIEEQPGEAEAYLERGNAYWARGERKRAEADFDAAIRLKPQPATFSLRGWFLKDGDETERATADFDRAITAANVAVARGGAGAATARHARGEALAGKGEYKDAIVDYDWAIRLAPEDEKFRLNRGIVHSLSGDRERALADASEAIRLQPEFYSAHAWRAQLQLSAAPDAALADAERAIALAGGNANGFLLRAAAHRFKTDYTRALADINEALRLRPEWEDAYNLRGWIYIDKQEYDRAVLDFSRALAAKPKFLDAVTGRGLAYFWLNDQRKALADRDALVNLAPSPQAFQVRADIHEVMRNKTAAISDRDQVVRLKPEDPGSYKKRAATYDWFHEPAKALADYNKVIDLRPNEAEGYRLRAKHHAENRAFDLAIADADTVLRMEPTIDSHLLRASVHVKAQRYDRALADAEEALHLAPTSLEALEARAAVYETMGDNERALADFETMVRLEPGNARVFAARGNHMLFRQRKTDRAIADFSEAIRLEPGQEAHYAMRARAYQVKGETAQALPDWQRAVAVNPALFSSNLADAYLGLGDLDRAIAVAEDAVKLNSGSATAYIQRAEILVKKKEYDKAAADLNDALRLAPNGPEAASALVTRANIFRVREDYQRALSDLRKVLEISPSLNGIRLVRAMTLLLVGDVDGAIAGANDAVRANPNALSYAGRCAIYMELKRWDAALKDCDEAVRLDPMDGSYATNRARALLGLGRTDEALTASEVSLRMDGGVRSSALRVHGLILAALGRHVEAIEDFSGAIKLDDEDPRVHVERAASYETLGMHAQALADYRKATELPVIRLSEREARIEARRKVAELEASLAASPEATGTLPQKPQAKPAEPGRRIALVIGVGGYKEMSPLPNPPNDARAMAAVFRRLGFADVIEVKDPTRSVLEEAVKSFGDKASQAEWAVVFYAGHGIQVDGRNFLIPTDAKLERDHHVAYETVPLDMMMDSAGGAKRLGLVILDACRDNPFLKRMIRGAGGTRSLSIGLASVQPRRGELVAFSTRDGHTAADGPPGENSPFTAAMLQHIEESDIDVDLVFRKVRDTVIARTGNQQQPFTYGSLPGEGLFFKVSAR